MLICSSSWKVQTKTTNCVKSSATIIEQLSIVFLKMFIVKSKPLPLYFQNENCARISTDYWSLFFLCWLVTLSFKTNLVWIQKKHLMCPFRWLLPLLLVWGIVLIQYCKHPLTDYHLYSKGLKKTVIFPHFILSLTQCLFYTQWLSVMLNNSHWFYLKNVHFLFHRAILPLVASTKLNQKNRKMTWI